MADEPPEWWRTWFGPDYLDVYDRDLQARAPRELDQLVTLLKLEPPLSVLDLACGQGRHAIELARRGYTVTGVDLSPFLLEVAAERSRSAGVQVRWLQGDMRSPPVTREFDLVLSLFTSFGYFDDEADNGAVLRAAAAALRDDGRLLLELINGERVLNHFQKRDWFTVGQLTVMDERRLDALGRRLLVRRTISRDSEPRTSYHSIRLYGGRELENLLRQAGFTNVELFGGWAGEPLTNESERLLAVAR